MHSHRTCILTIQLAQPIRCYVHWRTQVFKIEGFVCKRFLPFIPLSLLLPPLSFLALVSFLARPKPRIPFLDLSLPQNQTETLATQARIRLSHPFYIYLKLVLCPIEVPKVGLKVFFYWHVTVSDHITPSENAHAFSPFFAA